MTQGNNKGKPSGAARRGRRGGGERPRTSAPAPAERQAPAAPPAPRLDGPPGVVLERLRDRIHDVVRELDALRQENHRLSQQIAALQGETGADAVMLRLDESPEALREKIEGFIAALDTYLEGEGD